MRNHRITSVAAGLLAIGSIAATASSANASTVGRPSVTGSLSSSAVAANGQAAQAAASCVNFTGTVANVGGKLATQVHNSCAGSYNFAVYNYSTRVTPCIGIPGNGTRFPTTTVNFNSEWYVVIHLC